MNYRITWIDGVGDNCWLDCATLDEARSLVRAMRKYGGNDVRLFVQLADV